MLYNLEVFHDETKEVVRSFENLTENKAGRLERGLFPNFDHENYSIRTVPVSVSVKGALYV